MTDCPLLKNCLEVSGIDCKGREYPTCDFFRNLLGTYCDRKHSNCSKCDYTKECNRPNNKTKPALPSKSKPLPIQHDYKEEFRMPER